jgi:acyl-CoA thioesterase FadM
MKPSIPPPPIVTCRGFVQPWQLDALGRITPQCLVARCEEASWQLLSRLGCGPRHLHRERRAFVELEQRTTYHDQAGGAAVMHIETELLDVGHDTLHLRHRSCDSESQRTLAVMELTIALVELDSRARTALPAELVRRARSIFPAPRAADKADAGDNTPLLRAA